MSLNKNNNKRIRQSEEPAQSSKSKGGHPQNPVWDHFVKSPLSTAGHFAAECIYCKKKWARGRPQELQIHLAKDCIYVDDETRREYVQKILQLYNDDTENDKRFQLEQLNITDFWDADDGSIEELSKPKQEAIDQSLLKAFICCDIPFAVVEHPFFIGLVRKLRPGYTLPSRDKLAGIMLSHAVIRVENKVKAIPEKETNLTLGKYLRPINYNIANTNCTVLIFL